MIRKPAVAGTFYEMDPDALKRRIEWCFQHQLGPGSVPDFIGNKRDIKGLIAPHAGYMYSGPIAAHSYKRMAEDGFPETFVIICPNHTGMGSGVSTMTEGQWETPLGLVEVDGEFAVEMIYQTPLIDSEPSAHLQEHSCEVQLPFLQYLGEKMDRNFSIVPICMMMQDMETSTEIGDSINKVTKKLGRDVVVIASTDFTHYQPYEIAYQGDKQVLEAIKVMDEKLMMTRVAELNVTMCGYGPVSSTIIASKAMGAEKAEIMKYATSGDITGDHSAVVGYASAVFL
jgi:MEMO1 family protein